MEKKGEIHTKGKRYCYADFWISITQSMSKNYRKHNFTLIYSLTTQVKHGILSLQLIRKKAGEFMTQSKDTSAKEFDALFRSLEERYQMGELAILRALASIDSNDSDPPKKTSAWNTAACFHRIAAATSALNSQKSGKRHVRLRSVMPEGSSYLSPFRFSIDHQLKRDFRICKNCLLYTSDAADEL